MSVTTTMSSDSIYQSSCAQVCFLTFSLSNPPTLRSAHLDYIFRGRHAQIIEQQFFLVPESKETSQKKSTRTLVESRFIILGTFLYTPATLAFAHPERTPSYPTVTVPLTRLMNPLTLTVPLFPRFLSLGFSASSDGNILYFVEYCHGNGQTFCRDTMVSNIDALIECMTRNYPIFGGTLLEKKSLGAQTIWCTQSFEVTHIFYIFPIFLRHVCSQLFPRDLSVFRDTLVVYLSLLHFHSKHPNLYYFGACSPPIGKLYNESYTYAIPSMLNAITLTYNNSLNDCPRYGLPYCVTK